MVDYIESNSQVAFPSVDEAVGNLVPEVEDLLRRVCNVEPTATPVGDAAITLETPISFPDGIGSGVVCAELFRYRESIRLDIKIEHNRMFARAGGSPSDRKCFMNDYVASVTVEPGTASIPQQFVRQVVSGIAAARDAVRRHNRHARGVWDEIRVAAR